MQCLNYNRVLNKGFYFTVCRKIRLNGAPVDILTVEASLVLKYGCYTKLYLKEGFLRSRNQGGIHRTNCNRAKVFTTYQYSILRAAAAAAAAKKKCIRSLCENANA